MAGGMNSPTGAIVSGPLVPSTNRVNENRRCRDIVFLILFIAFWVGMIIVAGIGFAGGNPARLVYGLDYKGNLCDNPRGTLNLKGYDTRYWVNPNELYDSGNPISDFNLRNSRSICLKSCPKPTNETLSWVCNYPEGPNLTLSLREWAGRNYNYYDLLTEEQKNYSAKLQGPCYPVLFQNTEIFWSCQMGKLHNESYQKWLAPPINGVPIKIGSYIQDSIEKALNKPAAVLERYVADLGTAWRVLVVCAAVAPLILSFLWLIVIRFFTGLVAWLTVAVINILFIVVTGFFYVKSGWVGATTVNTYVSQDVQDQLLLESVAGSTQTHLKTVAVIMTILTIILILVTFVMLRRIMIAIAVLKVAAKAIGSIPLLIFFPLVPFTVIVIFITYWIAVALFIFSAGKITQNTCEATDCCAYSLAAGQLLCGVEHCCGFSIDWDKNMKYFLLYHIFGYFWTMQFIIACTSTIIAGAIASYYWAQGDTHAMPMVPIIASTKRLVFYSLGSMALGSLIVAIIEMIRFLLEYIRRKLKAAEEVPGGSILTMVCCCAQCCLGCIEYTVKFINRNAYIIIAITGSSFCSAAGRATSLIINNVLRVAAVNIIGDAMLFLGKLCVSMSCALFAFLMLDTHRYQYGADKVSSPLFPVLFCWFAAYVVASIFFAVVEMAVDTILLSFCEDCEENGGTARFAPPLLLDALGKAKKIDEDDEAHRARRKALNARVATRNGR